MKAISTMIRTIPLFPEIIQCPKTEVQSCPLAAESQPLRLRNGPKFASILVRKSTRCDYLYYFSHSERQREAEQELISEYNHLDGNSLSTSTVGLTSFDKSQHKKIAVLQAKKQSSIPIQEQEKPLATYMTLPASQYSVLDARKIERLDENTFRCYVGGFEFFNFRVEPVLTLSVVVGERGPTVQLLETALQGSQAAIEANKRFTATMTNIVEWMEVDGEKQISSDTSLEVTLAVPQWFVFPVSIVERSGSAVMQTVLEKAVPRFLHQLTSDYEKWVLGDDRPIMSDEE